MACVSFGTPFMSSSQPLTELEGRLSQLERRVVRQQRTIIALLICALCAVGATRAISQSAGEQLTVRTLNIVGSDGKLRAILSGDASLNAGGGSLALLDSRGDVRLGLMAKPGGGSVSVFDGRARPMAILGARDDEGALSLASGRSGARVSVAVTPRVSGLTVAGANGRQQLVTGADGTGGMTQMFDARGQLKKRLP